MSIKTLRIATAALILCGATSLTACASHEETTTTVTRPATADSSEATTTTTVVRTDDEEHHDSVLGATVHAVVTIVLLPFRLVGDAIELIV